MKKFILGAICAAALAFTQSANAVLVESQIVPFGGDVSKNSVGASPAQVFSWLSSLPGLPATPSDANVQNFEDLNGTGPTIPIVGPAYLVLHYGVGQGGVQGTGGGLVALFFTGSGNYDVPDNGSGLNGFGGISFGRLFPGTPGNSVPDGGATLPLLAMGIAGLFGIARFQRKTAR